MEKTSEGGELTPIEGRRDQAQDPARGHEEFCERGYHGATIASIAKGAEVANQTVYFVFHTKAELISAAIDALVMGEDQPAIPQEAEWWRAMQDEPDAADALRQFVRGAGPLFQRTSTLGEVLRAAALTDDEVRRTHDHHEQLRATGFREVVELLATKGSLRQGLTVDTATDILLVAFSDSAYVQLTTDRGWSHDHGVTWFCDAPATSTPRMSVRQGAERRCEAGPGA